MPALRAWSPKAPRNAASGLENPCIGGGRQSWAQSSRRRAREAMAAFRRRLNANRLKASRRRSASGPEADQQLAAWLGAQGFAKTDASVTNKLARATMTADFFLASLVARVLGIDGVF